MTNSWRLVHLGALCLSVAACASPISAVRADQKTVYHDLGRSAATTGESSWPTLHLPWDAESVSIAGEQVPLEAEPTAALALTFTGVPIVEIEAFGLLGRRPGLFKDRPPLISTTPYTTGLIPVVFVHGTESSVLATQGAGCLPEQELRRAGPRDLKQGMLG